ncbi:MAG: Serine/threonine-protein phosphatase [candidate division TM6 bacterium GW2011_GWF2_38_10]|nr:MAG: Serine/threonine-protein phosphatase [candidate division TM6 bacterium GW2011_GWF2_38_10]
MKKVVMLLFGLLIVCQEVHALMEQRFFHSRLHALPSALYYKNLMQKTSLPEEKKVRLPRLSSQDVQDYYQSYEGSIPYTFTTFSLWSARCFSSYDEQFSNYDYLSDSILPAQELLRVLYDFRGKAASAGVRVNVSSDESDESSENYIKNAHAAQVRLEGDSTICFIGDLHGSIHSLLRNLWRLVALGYLGDDFVIKDKHFHMVFTGDYVDRGRYGAEVLYTLLRLKCANWDSVFLVRGNHELPIVNNRIVSKGGGFSKELQLKYADNADYVKSMIYRAYQDLPLALYITKESKTILACHGGFAPFPYYTELLKKFQTLSAEKKVYYLPITLDKNELISCGFQWCDIYQCDSVGVPQEILADSLRVWAMSVPCVLKKMHEAGVCAFFRGHQHREYGMKMFLHQATYDHLQMDSSKRLPSIFHWRVALKYAPLGKGIDEHNGSGFLLKNHIPVFTFSSATEGVGIPFDCFGLLFAHGDYDFWRLKVFEYPCALGFSSYKKNSHVFTQIVPNDNEDTRVLNDVLQSTSGIKDIVSIQFSLHAQDEDDLKKTLIDIASSVSAN